MRKHDIENFNFSIFPIIKYGQNNADFEEKRLIKQFNSFGKNGYNMTEGGMGVGSGVNNYNYGKKQSKEHIRKSAEKRTGGKRTLETRKKISIAKLGKEPWNKGVPRTKEEKKNISKARTGIIPDVSKEIKEKLSFLRSKKYRIYFNDKMYVEVYGLSQWCKKNGYDLNAMNRILNKTSKRYKNIWKIERIK